MVSILIRAYNRTVLKDLATSIHKNLIMIKLN
jgi:hypothetical protein